ncbi:uncharacterized protein LOC118753862 [Rhagoletis pomonella]|uniref:uncharacterized protein LOC118753862 n=1 Tax=Rhagoletis pomonella TaxID=28610 RepID=UPI00177CF485|nr:uncharacterized protein LOC118753862 [Rhagoletis pomonella]
MCQGYADDIVIIARGKIESALCDIVQRALTLTKRWCGTVGLNIKTAIIPITKRGKLPAMHPITLGGIELEMCNEVKYLGVRPIATYGAVAWSQRITFNTVRASLSKVQRRACTCITGAMRTCLTAALEVILDLTPLYIVIEQIAKKALLNFMKEGTGRGKVISSRLGYEIRSKIPISQLNRDDMSTTKIFEKKFRIELGNKATWNETNLENTFKAHTQRWFTDGSKTDEGIGAGIFGPRAKISIPLGNYPSIFQAEVYAISACAEIILQRQARLQHIVICSDSQAALKAISSCEIKSRVVWECVARLNILGENKALQLVWVPGHKGIQGNEEADRLAREAAAT